ncbi:MAG: hypothetical protein H6746_01585 [Deltaproteobacteria bacterium]|nr:hypothetical protein [Deltaproteobacteria bacterium]
MRAELDAAVATFGSWVNGAGEGFCPKEETLQGWFCAALLQSKVAEHPTQIIQEIHLGDATELNALPPHLRERRGQTRQGGRAHWRYDIAVLAERAAGAVRDLERLSRPPRLLVEIKALNSAGTLSMANLRSDLRKLDLAREYLDRLWPHAGSASQETILLMLIVATDCNGVSSRDEVDVRIERIERGVPALHSKFDKVQVALILPTTRR